VTDPYLKVHCLAPGLNYGQHTFEGIKAYRSADNSITIFRPQLNAERLQHSNDMLSIPPIPTEHFLKCVDLAVGMNAAYVPPYETGGAMYIRPVSFGSSAQLGLNPPEEYTFFVYCVPSGVYHGTAPISCLVCEDFDRTAPRGTGSTKCGGNYGPVLKWSQRAHNEGYGICLHLDSQTRSEIDEFSTAGFVGLKEDSTGNVTLVTPDSPCIIRSSTSTASHELAKSFGWKVEHRPIPVTELGEFAEIAAAGTAAALVPVKSIELKSKGKKWEYRGMDGQVGPLVTKLLKNLRGIQSGDLPDPFGWQYHVHDPAPWVREQEAKKLKMNPTNDVKVDGKQVAVDELP
jgi:branched-chain amino acid aminotransferase